MLKVLIMVVCALIVNLSMAHCGGCKSTVVQEEVLMASHAVSHYGSHASKKGETVKQAILLVAFGTSEKSAQVSFENIAKLAKEKFSGYEIRWAFTSKMIRKKLARLEGKQLDSPSMALEKLADEGFEKVIVQSLHTIPGAEFDDLCATVKLAKHQKGGIAHIAIGQPLVANYANLDRVVDLMLKSAPVERKNTEAVIFMGHGTHHYANLIYVAFQALLNDKDKNAFIGTVEGNPTLDDIIAKCKKNNIKKAYLIPFMSVAGDHAKNDMASDEDDSWKSVLKANGIDAISILKGTAENDKIVEVWLDNCQTAIEGNSH